MKTRTNCGLSVTSNSILDNEKEFDEKKNYSAQMHVVSSKDFLDIQTTIECGFTLKRVRDMIGT